VVFHFSLDSSAFSAHLPGPVDAPEDVDDYTVAVIEACQILADTGLRFAFSGFGLDDWRLDIQYDLSVFMEQFPEMLSAVRGGEPYEFYFYSQGVERSLMFTPEREWIQIRCVSGTSWVPDPEIEKITLASLIKMLERMALVFSTTLREAGMVFSEREPFRSWAEGKVVVP
jgi:hypothetical protein